jgi:DNA-binding transcriptional MerR regulator
MWGVSAIASICLWLALASWKWRCGCIIRAALLEDICAAFHARRDLPNLLFAPNLSRKVVEHQEYASERPLRQARIKQKGNIMKTTFKPKDIEQILAEADELLQQIDPEIIEDMEEEQRAQLEQQAKSLKKLKSEVQDKIGNEGAPESSSYGEGVHEAMDDIVNAMTALASYLSPRKSQAS